MSIGRMETKEPPESTSGPEPIAVEPILDPDPETGLPDGSLEPAGPAEDEFAVDDDVELSGPGEDEAGEVAAPPVVAVVVTTGGP